ncbi:MAG: hypothetical protein OXH31_00945 [Gammaproteobacteria bacterium]|nr:hypothetical protein [Gammaproteobacteria bacterium]
MTKFSNKFLCGVSFIALLAIVPVFADIEGTYTLEASEGSSFKWKQPELTINLDAEGTHSATLTKRSGEILLNTEDVEIHEKEFKATFTTPSGMGELKFVFSGLVEDSEMSGTILESTFGSEVKFTGTLKSKFETNQSRSDETDYEDANPDDALTDNESMDAEVVGTYFLEYDVAEDMDESSFNWTNPFLIIKRDEEEEYSAFTAFLVYDDDDDIQTDDSEFNTNMSDLFPDGKVLTTQEVEVDNNEFKVNFSVASRKGDFEITYVGQVENGGLTGTITESKFGTGSKLVGKLRKEVETNKTHSFD